MCVHAEGVILTPHNAHNLWLPNLLTKARPKQLRLHTELLNEHLNPDSDSTLWSNPLEIMVY